MTIKTIDDARNLYVRAADLAREVLPRLQGAEAPRGWWPESQSEATVLSHAVAIRWAAEIPLEEHPRFLCMNTGRSKDGLSPTAKQALLTTGKIPVFNKDAGQPGLCFLRGEAMLDMVVFPDPTVVTAGAARTVALLTVESETHAHHGVGDAISRYANGYAWDFFKLVWLPSPRRLFIARVGALKGATESARIETLRKSLDRIVGNYPFAFAADDVLVVIILAETKPQESVIKVMVGGKVDAGSAWARLFPQ